MDHNDLDTRLGDVEETQNGTQQQLLLARLESAYSLIWRSCLILGNRSG